MTFPYAAELRELIGERPPQRSGDKASASRTISLSLWTNTQQPVRHGRVTKAMKETARILVVGGGHVGMYTALRLQRKLRHQLKRTAQRQNQDGGTHGGVEIVVLDPEPYMTYQPFLPEAAAGSISPRHVVVPLRRVLTGCRLVIGKAVSIDHGKRVAHFSTLAAAEEGAGPVEIPYTELVLAPGSVSRTLPVPGLSEYGIGFKTVEEAIGLRNHVLEQLDLPPPPATPKYAPPPSRSSSSAAATRASRRSPNSRTWPETPAATITTYGRRK
jgi:NADH:ubiquinone reductase (H+-translocating)